jgi:hypothetical protein
MQLFFELFLSKTQVGMIRNLRSLHQERMTSLLLQHEHRNFSSFIWIFSAILLSSQLIP